MVWPADPPPGYRGQLEPDFQRELAAKWDDVRLEDCYFYHSVLLPDGSFVKGPWDLIGNEKEYLGGIDLKGRTVFEYGPASGWLTHYMSEQGADVTIIDIGWDLSTDLIPLGTIDLEQTRREQVARAGTGRELVVVCAECLRPLGEGRLRAGLRPSPGPGPLRRVRLRFDPAAPAGSVHGDGAGRRRDRRCHRGGRAAPRHARGRQQDGSVLEPHRRARTQTAGGCFLPASSPTCSPCWDSPMRRSATTGSTTSPRPTRSWPTRSRSYRGRPQALRAGTAIERWPRNDWARREPPVRLR